MTGMIDVCHPLPSASGVRNHFAEVALFIFMGTHSRTAGTHGRNEKEGKIFVVLSGGRVRISLWQPRRHGRVIPGDGISRVGRRTLRRLWSKYLDTGG